MKKHLIVILLILSMLAMFTGTVAAAPQSDAAAALTSVIFVPGKGPVFTFSIVGGKFSKRDLNGFVHVEGGNDFGLHCRQVDENTITCTTSKKTAGKDVVASWGGGTFWAHVPVAPTFCYQIYDWNYDLPNPPDHWALYGSYCQDTPVDYGDYIEWDNPDWGSSPYYFLPGSPSCFAEDIANDAYYFPFCPF